MGLGVARSTPATGAGVGEGRFGVSIFGASIGIGAVVRESAESLAGAAIAAGTTGDGVGGVTVASGFGSESHPAMPMVSRRARHRRKRMASTLPNPFDAGVDRLDPIS